RCLRQLLSRKAAGTITISASKAPGTMTSHRLPELRALTCCSWPPPFALLPPVGDGAKLCSGIIESTSQRCFAFLSSTANAIGPRFEPLGGWRTRSIVTSPGYDVNTFHVGLSAIVAG